MGHDRFGGSLSTGMLQIDDQIVEVRVTDLVIEVVLDQLATTLVGVTNVPPCFRVGTLCVSRIRSTRMASGATI